MNTGLAGRTAMVAAGSKGIGWAIAKGLAAEGCRVSICARDESLFPSLHEKLGDSLMAVRADVTSLPDIEHWFAATTDAFGEPDVLVTNTGGPPAGLWPTMTDDQWQSGFESTLLNVVRMVRLAAPGMKDRGWGRIVHLTSLVAKEPNPLLPISTTLRSGLMGLTRLQATELAPFGVTVNGVLPGHTLTDRQIHLAEIKAERAGISVEEALKQTAMAIPIRRLASPEEIAAPVVFLCSELASYVTGVSLLVDGGSVHGLG